MDWIKLGDFHMDDKLPDYPKNEVLATDGRGGFKLGILQPVHDGNSRDRVYFTCTDSKKASCLPYVAYYALLTNPNN